MAGLAEQRRLLVAGDARDGMDVPNSAGTVWPTTSLERATRGSTAAGMRNRRNSSSSQHPSWMLNSRVREALLMSVTCALPPVSCHTSQLSMVPKASSPRSARSRAPGKVSSSQASLLAEK